MTLKYQQIWASSWFSGFEPDIYHSISLKNPFRKSYLLQPISRRIPGSKVWKLNEHWSGPIKHVLGVRSKLFCRVTFTQFWWLGSPPHTYEHNHLYSISYQKNDSIKYNGECACALMPMDKLEMNIFLIVCYKNFIHLCM